MQPTLRSVLWIVLGSLAAPLSPPASLGQSAPEALPGAVDLRPAFQEFQLAPRRQGGRPTCSAFTVAGALEFASAKKQGRGARLSVEFLNWASNQACGEAQDGGFFSDLWKGFATYGICPEEDMPYQARFDPTQSPGAGALTNARTRLALGLRLHWIKEWNVNTGLTVEHLTAIKRTLSQGWPVCSGLRWPKQETWENDVLQWCPADAVRDGHSVLVVGYREDSSQPGGGVLIFRNTARNGRDGFMPYQYAQAYMNDAVWVDAATPPPNILFIMTDDHAAHALSCYGSKVNQTPNLDRLAQNGLRFSQAFVPNSICTPSRASILTGQYSHLNGVPVFNRFDGTKLNVAKCLQAAGYATAIIGKWHLGSDPTGFDQWIVLPGQGVYNEPFFLTPNGRLKIRGYVTDVITDLGIEFLQKRPKDKPFFLMLHHKAPHREWTPAPQHREMFKNRIIPEPPTLFDDYATRPAALPENAQTVARDLTRNDLKLEPPASLKPEERQKWLAAKPMQVEITLPGGDQQVLTGEALVKWKYQRYMQDYLACVQSVDDNVGRLLDYLDQSGLAANTVVFYTSDNGFYLGDLGLYDKRFMYEPGLRVPLLVRWPGEIPAGTTSDRFALNVDFAPTFLELAGAPVPPGMQGRSLVSLFKGVPPSDWREAIYYRYYHDPGHHNTRAHLGLRTATHKLIHYWKQDAWELYDLAADPLEQKNLANDPAHGGLLEKLKTQLARLKREMKDDDQFATALPKDGVDSNFPDHGQLGLKSVADAIASSRTQQAQP